MDTPDARAAAETDIFIPADFLIRSGALVVDLFVVAAAQSVTAALGAALRLPEPLLALQQAAVSLAYFTWMVAARNGQTLGKKAAAIAVVRVDGGPVGYGRALGRALAWSLSALPAGLGFLAALRGAQRRALHDYVAGTRVVSAAELPPRRRKVLAALGLLPIPAFLLAMAYLFSGPEESIDPLAPEAGIESSLEDPSGLLDDLAGLRAALASELDKRGAYPAALADPPPVDIPEHGPQEGAQAYAAEACSGPDAVDGSKLKDTGKWGYVSDRAASCRGHVFIDCTHLDELGRPWFER